MFWSEQLWKCLLHWLHVNVCGECTRIFPWGYLILSRAMKIKWFLSFFLFFKLFFFFEKCYNAADNEGCSRGKGERQERGESELPAALQSPFQGSWGRQKASPVRDWTLLGKWWEMTVLIFCGSTVAVVTHLSLQELKLCIVHMESHPTCFLMKHRSSSSHERQLVGEGAGPHVSVEFWNV